MELYKIMGVLCSETDTATKMLHIEKLITAIPTCNMKPYERRLHNWITTNINHPNADMGKCVLTLYGTCVANGLLVDQTHIDVAYDALKIAVDADVESVEGQELFLKAVDVLVALDHLFVDLYKAKSKDVVSILSKTLTLDVTSLLQKNKAVELFNKLVLSVTEKPLQYSLIKVWCETFFPVMFSSTNRNLQENIVEKATELLPYLRTYNQQYNFLWLKICADIKPCEKVMKNLITENNILFSKIWIFLIKLFHQELDKKLGILNDMLSVVDMSFKSPSPEILVQAFYCWQEFIRGYELHPLSINRLNLIRLILTPLVYNKSKSEELTHLKFDTWCVLLNVIYKSSKNVVDFPQNVLEQFLAFCFILSSIKGSNQVVSACKKYQSMNLKCSHALLRIIGIDTYIDEKLKLKLDEMKFLGPLITPDNFLHFSSLVVNAVKESCVLLRHLSNENNEECSAVNKALWLSLFSLVDSIENVDEKLKIVQEISVVVEKLICYTNKRLNFSPRFVLETLLTIIITHKFKFCHNTDIPDRIFISLLTLLMSSQEMPLRELSALCSKVLLYKQSTDNYLTFIKSIITTISNNDNRSIYFLNLWCLLQEALFNYLKNTKDIDVNICTEVYHKFLVSPFAVLRDEEYELQDFSNKWTNLYILFGGCVSSPEQNKLANLVLTDLVPHFEVHSYPLAEFVVFIIVSLKFCLDFSEENHDDLVAVFNALQKIIFIPSSLRVVSKYKTCVLHIFEQVNQVSCVERLFPIMNMCLEHILVKYNEIEAISGVTKFLRLLKYNKNVQPGLEQLCNIIKKMPTTKETTNILTMIDNFNLPAPVKEPGRKLTKHQKEMLKKRSDDIPALYEDISRSQTQTSLSSDTNASEDTLNLQRPFGHLSEESPNNLSLSQSNDSKKLKNELRRIRIDGNDPNEYMNLSDKRRTRWGYLSLIEQSERKKGVCSDSEVDNLRTRSKSASTLKWTDSDKNISLTQDSQNSVPKKRGRKRKNSIVEKSNNDEITSNEFSFEQSQEIPGNVNDTENSKESEGEKSEETSSVIKKVRRNARTKDNKFCSDTEQKSSTRLPKLANHNQKDKNLKSFVDCSFKNDTIEKYLIKKDSNKPELPIPAKKRRRGKSVDEKSFDDFVNRSSQLLIDCSPKDLSFESYLIQKQLNKAVSDSEASVSLTKKGKAIEKKSCDNGKQSTEDTLFVLPEKDNTSTNKSSEDKLKTGLTKAILEPTLAVKLTPVMINDESFEQKSTGKTVDAELNSNSSLNLMEIKEKFSDQLFISTKDKSNDESNKGNDLARFEPSVTFTKIRQRSISIDKDYLLSNNDGEAGCSKDVTITKVYSNPKLLLKAKSQHSADSVNSQSNDDLSNSQMESQSDSELFVKSSEMKNKSKPNKSYQLVADEKITTIEIEPDLELPSEKVQRFSDDMMNEIENKPSNQVKNLEVFVTKTCSKKLKRSSQSIDSLPNVQRDAKSHSELLTQLLEVENKSIKSNQVLTVKKIKPNKSKSNLELPSTKFQSFSDGVMNEIETKPSSEIKNLELFTTNDPQNKYKCQSIDNMSNSQTQPESDSEIFDKPLEMANKLKPTKSNQPLTVKKIKLNKLKSNFESTMSRKGKLFNQTFIDDAMNEAKSKPLSDVKDPMLLKTKETQKIHELDSQNNDDLTKLRSEIPDNPELFQKLLNMKNKTTSIKTKQLTSNKKTKSTKSKSGVEQSKKGKSFSQRFNDGLVNAAERKLLSDANESNLLFKTKDTQKKNKLDSQNNDNLFNLQTESQSDFELFADSQEMGTKSKITKNTPFMTVKKKKSNKSKLDFELSVPKKGKVTQRFSDGIINDTTSGSAKVAKIRKRSKSVDQYHEELEEPNNLVKSIKLKALLNSFNQVEYTNVTEASVENQSDDVNIRPCSVPGLYNLDGIKPGEQIAISNRDSTVDVVKGPKPTSPFKIVEKTAPKSETEQIVSDESESPDTLSLTSQMPLELYEPCTSPPPSTSENIATSPVSCDTPTRNHELITCTLELSPIKSLPEESRDGAISPELFSEPFPESSTNASDDIVTNDNKCTFTIRRTRKKSVMNRGAQMVELINPAVVLIKNNISKKKKTVPNIIARSSLMKLSPKQSRITKIMNEVKLNESQETADKKEMNQDENFLEFCRRLPSPSTPTLPSILKRTMEEESTESPPTKKRRLSFKDPLETVKFYKLNQTETDNVQNDRRRLRSTTFETVSVDTVLLGVTSLPSDPISSDSVPSDTSVPEETSNVASFKAEISGPPSPEIDVVGIDTPVVTPLDVTASDALTSNTAISDKPADSIFSDTIVLSDIVSTILTDFETTNDELPTSEQDSQIKNTGQTSREVSVITSTSKKTEHMESDCSAANNIGFIASIVQYKDKWESLAKELKFENKDFLVEMRSSLLRGLDIVNAVITKKDLNSIEPMCLENIEAIMTCANRLCSNGLASTESRLELMKNLAHSMTYQDFMSYFYKP